MAFNPNNCLKLQAYEDTTIQFVKYGYFPPGADYFFSVDNGVTWVQNEVTVAAGDFVYVKGTDYPADGATDVYSLHIKGSFDIVGGNVYSLVDDGAGNAPKAIDPGCGFRDLFAGSGVRKVTANILPFTEITDYCYYEMFSGCASLIEVPDTLLPAKILKEYCYAYMFRECYYLKKAPSLPAEDPVNFAYYYMFHYDSRLNYINCNLKHFYIPYMGMYDTCTGGWVNFNQATVGNFYKNPVANTDRGIDQIPEGWTIAGDYIDPDWPDPPGPTPPGPTPPEARKSVSFVYFGNITVGGTF